MKLREEFRIQQPVTTVWEFFQDPERVTGCLPGIEHVRVVDLDNVDVKATQSIGPLSATFEAKVTVLERVPHQRIRFQAVGRSVRGASGNVRATNVVHLDGSTGATSVVVEGDVALAGALGSVGQKVVARQAGRMTAAFADNLRAALNGEVVSVSAASPASAAEPGRRAAGRPPRSRRRARGLPVPGTAGVGPSPDLWGIAAAALSAVSAAASIAAYLRLRRRTR